MSKNTKNTDLNNHRLSDLVEVTENDVDLKVVDEEITEDQDVLVMESTEDETESVNATTQICHVDDSERGKLVASVDKSAQGVKTDLKETEESEEFMIFDEFSSTDELISPKGTESKHSVIDSAVEQEVFPAKSIKGREESDDIVVPDTDWGDFEVVDADEEISPNADLESAEKPFVTSGVGRSTKEETNGVRANVKLDAADDAITEEPHTPTMDEAPIEEILQKSVVLPAVSSVEDSRIDSTENPHQHVDMITAIQNDPDNGVQRSLLSASEDAEFMDSVDEWQTLDEDVEADAKEEPENLEDTWSSEILSSIDDWVASDEIVDEGETETGKGKNPADLNHPIKRHKKPEMPSGVHNTPKKPIRNTIPAKNVKHRNSIKRLRVNKSKSPERKSSSKSSTKNIRARRSVEPLRKESDISRKNLPSRFPESKIRPLFELPKKMELQKKSVFGVNKPTVRKPEFKALKPTSHPVFAKKPEVRSQIKKSDSQMRSGPDIVKTKSHSWTEEAVGKPKSGTDRSKRTVVSGGSGCLSISVANRVDKGSGENVKPSPKEEHGKTDRHRQDSDDKKNSVDRFAHRREEHHSTRSKSSEKHHSHHHPSTSKRIPAPKDPHSTSIRGKKGHKDSKGPSVGGKKDSPAGKSTAPKQQGAQPDSKVREKPKDQTVDHRHSKSSLTTAKKTRLGALKSDIGSERSLVPDKGAVAPKSAKAAAATGHKNEPAERKEKVQPAEKSQALTADAPKAPEQAVQQKPAMHSKPPPPEVLQYLNSLVELEYDSKRYTWFYCVPCQDTLAKTAVWEEHMSDIDHRKKSAIWRECRDLISLEQASDRPASKQKLIEKAFGVVTGADYVVEVNDPMSGFADQWICCLCYVICDTTDRLVAHLTSFTHIDNHIERVRADIYAPPFLLQEGPFPGHEEIKRAAREYMASNGRGKIKSITGEKLVADLPDLEMGMDLDEVMVKERMGELFESPDLFVPSYRKLDADQSVANKYLLNNPKAARKPSILVGLQYMVEFWAPSRRCAPSYYCILCNYVTMDFLVHCSAMKHTILYFMRHYKSVYDCVINSGVKNQDDVRKGIEVAKQRIMGLEGWSERVNLVVELQDDKEIFVAMNSDIAKIIINDLNFKVGDPKRKKPASALPAKPLPASKPPPETKKQSKPVASIKGMANNATHKSKTQDEKTRSSKATKNVERSKPLPKPLFSAQPITPSPIGKTSKADAERLFKESEDRSRHPPPSTPSSISKNTYSPVSKRKSVVTLFKSTPTSSKPRGSSGPVIDARKFVSPREPLPRSPFYRSHHASERKNDLDLKRRSDERGHRELVRSTKSRSRSIGRSRGQRRSRSRSPRGASYINKVLQSATSVSRGSKPERSLSAQDLERLQIALKAVKVDLDRPLTTGDLAMLRLRFGDNHVDRLLDQVCGDGTAGNATSSRASAEMQRISPVMLHAGSTFPYFPTCVQPPNLALPPPAVLPPIPVTHATLTSRVFPQPLPMTPNVSVDEPSSVFALHQQSFFVGSTSNERSNGQNSAPIVSTDHRKVTVPPWTDILPTGVALHDFAVPSSSRAHDQLQHHSHSYYHERDDDRSRHARDTHDRYHSELASTSTNADTYASNPVPLFVKRIVQSGDGSGSDERLVIRGTPGLKYAGNQPREAGAQNLPPYRGSSSGIGPPRLARGRGRPHPYSRDVR